MSDYQIIDLGIRIGFSQIIVTCVNALFLFYSWRELRRKDANQTRAKEG